MDKAIYARAILAEMLGGYARWPELVKRVPLALNTDCRSLYDHLKRDAGTPAEKRVALDLLDVRAELQDGTNIGWVNTHRMLADVLTKHLPDPEVLHKFMSDGDMALWSSNLQCARPAS